MLLIFVFKIKKPFQFIKISVSLRYFYILRHHWHHQQSETKDAAWLKYAASAKVRPSPFAGKVKIHPISFFLL